MDDDARIQFGEDTIERIKAADGTNAYKRRISVQEADHESVFSEKGDGVRESDFKKRQVCPIPMRCRVLHCCSIGSVQADPTLGFQRMDAAVVGIPVNWRHIWYGGHELESRRYALTTVGDIGTSPLYVYSSTFTSEPAEQDLLGALSLITWALTIIVTVKYIFIVLRADDEGEGGTFAIYTLLSRYSDIMRQDPRANRLVKMQRHGTNELHASNNSIRTWLEKSKIAHGLLKVLAVLGVSLIMADGILTPAQSVLGAIQGLEVVKPDITSGTIVGVSCAILVLLFVVQPLGIHRLSYAFAPVVIIWLLFNGCFGVYNLVMHDWRVLRAFSPYYAGDWFVRNKTTGWINLGGILLAFTGVEALFADLGAFSRRAIQLSWLCLAYPCLLLAYTGQAAYISRDPAAYSNPFFQTVPPGMFYPSLVIAIMAAVVASQALITSTFQLLSQVMHSSYFPHITVIYTSDKFHGQVYIPMANWLMMIGTVIVTAVYSNVSRAVNLLYSTFAAR